MNSSSGHSDSADLTDGRKPGEFHSRYPRCAWYQIVSELLYLLVVLLVSAACLLVVGLGAIQARAVNPITVLEIFELPRDRVLLIWLAIWLSGTCGGVAFSLKWLYHSVAWQTWNRDRWLWRFVVPIQSGLLALFLAFMVVSGIVPFFNKNSFQEFYIALGFGFFVGYFSDNALAALQRLATKTFGTIDASGADKR